MTDRRSQNGVPSSAPPTGALSSVTPSRRVSSLRDLPLEIAPSRDLWPEIEGRLKSAGAQPRRLSLRHALRPRYFAAAAALVAAVGVGILIGRGLLPGGRGGENLGPAVVPSQMLPATFINDPRYLHARAQLLKNLNARLASLPPPSQQKVLASLATIHQSMRDIQAALGREPGNALLQEMLLDSYQDEMRVLTAVQEAGSGEI